MNQVWTIFFPRLLSGSIFGSLAVIMFILFVFLRGEYRYLYLYLSLSGFCMGFWVFSHIPDELSIRILPPIFASDFARYVPAYLAPILLLLFFTESTFGRDYKKILGFLCGVHVIFFVVAWLLNIIVDDGWLKANAEFNILIFISGSVMLFISIKMTIIGNKQAKIFLISLFILTILIGCDTLSFSCKQWLYHYNVWFLLPPFKKTPVTHYGVLCVYLSQIVILSQHQIEVLQKIKLAEKNQAKVDGITLITQMLAHDVRKPLTMLEGLLMLFKNTLNPVEIREMAHNFIPDVQKEIITVNSMIDDVMQIGRTVKPRKKPVSPEVIIEDSLREICRIHQKADIQIQYEYNHEHLLMVDMLKIQRVFSNIVGNAFQAMNNKGVIWFKSNEDTNKGWTTFCIGNSGSYVPKEDLPKLFDTFFSKNKAQGTGLGLAIAKKNILAHGGKIWCESSEQKKIVEFFFTLPINKDVKNKRTVILPLTTKELIMDFYRKSELKRFYPNH